MVRTQISLSADEQRHAREKAHALGISLAEYIRRLVRADMGAPPKRRADISEIFGLFDSGGSDIGRFKDEYIGDAVEADWRRSARRDA